MQLNLSFLFQFAPPSLHFTRAVTFRRGCQSLSACGREKGVCVPACMQHVLGKPSGERGSGGQNDCRLQFLQKRTLRNINGYRCAKAQGTFSDMLSEGKAELLQEQARKISSADISEEK